MRKVEESPKLPFFKPSGRLMRSIGRFLLKRNPQEKFKKKFERTSAYQMCVREEPSNMKYSPSWNCISLQNIPNASTMRCQSQWKPCEASDSSKMTPRGDAVVESEDMKALGRSRGIDMWRAHWEWFAKRNSSFLSTGFNTEISMSYSTCSRFRKRIIRGIAIVLLREWTIFVRLKNNIKKGLHYSDILSIPILWNAAAWRIVKKYP